MKKIEQAILKLLVHAEKEGHAHTAKEVAASIPYPKREVLLAMATLATRGAIYQWKKHWRPRTTGNPSPGERKHGQHASATQRIAEAKALKKARDFYDSDDLVTVPKQLKGYQTPAAFVEIGDFVALEYDSDKDGKPRIYRHEATKKRRFLMSVDGSTIIAWPPFKLTKRGIEG